MTDLMLQLLLPLPCSRMPPQCGAMEASGQRTSPQATSFSPGAAIQELVLELEQQRREQELELGLNTLSVSGRVASEGVSVGHSEGKTVSEGSSSGSLASLLSLWEGLVPTMLLEREASYNNWKKSFNDLQKREMNEERFAVLSTNVAESSSNIMLNRYNNVLAYDQSRVVVTHDDKEIYVNANIVKVPAAGRNYILSQGPLDCTVDDFWLMCHQQNSDTIVMLCNCVEMDRQKSAKYWPEEVGDTLLLGDTREGLGLEVSLDEEEDMGHYVTRTFTLTDQVSGEERKIRHFHYTDWPDFNVPKSPDCFLEFLLAVRRSGCFSESGGPPVVHCSAGIGRSGTLCLVDSCLVMAEAGTDLSLSTVLETLLEMRTQRMGLIQTEDQLRFSVEALVVGVHRLLGEELGGARSTSGSKRLKSSEGDSGEEGDADGEEAQKPEAKKQKNSES